jgi:hypothetical protein
MLEQRSKLTTGTKQKTRNERPGSSNGHQVGPTGLMPSHPAHPETTNKQDQLIQRLNGRTHRFDAIAPCPPENQESKGLMPSHPQKAVGPGLMPSHPANQRLNGRTHRFDAIAPCPPENQESKGLMPSHPWKAVGPGLMPSHPANR